MNIRNHRELLSPSPSPGEMIRALGFCNIAVLAASSEKLTHSQQHIGINNDFGEKEHQYMNNRVSLLYLYIYKYIKHDKYCERLCS